MRSWVRKQTYWETTMAARGLKPVQLVEAAAIARRYFLQDRSKKEIGEEFGISRFRVSRILDRARATGLVRITIDLPASIDAELSDLLRAAYSLRHAIVVTTPHEPEQVLRAHLGEIAAHLLGEIVEEDDVLGISWGRTLNVMTASLTTLARCTVVQLTGAAGEVDVTENSVEIVRRVASISGGPAFPIYAPLIVDTAETAAAIRRQPQVAEAMHNFDRLTKAVVAIGSWDPPNSQLRDAMAVPEREALRALGVRAEICATLVDDEGRAVAGDLMERAIAISAEQLRRIPEVIAVAGGPSKAAAIRAVLAGGFITSLVTDTSAARTLLEDVPTTTRSSRS
jgi:DNA-binding transcriptional regulator LsrR (DeoR family)